MCSNNYTLKDAFLLHLFFKNCLGNHWMISHMPRYFLFLYSQFLYRFKCGMIREIFYNFYFGEFNNFLFTQHMTKHCILPMDNISRQIASSRYLEFVKYVCFKILHIQIISLIGLLIFLKPTLLCTLLVLEKIRKIMHYCC